MQGHLTDSQSLARRGRLLFSLLPLLLFLAPSSSPSACVPPRTPSCYGLILLSYLHHMPEGIFHLPGQIPLPSLKSWVVSRQFPCKGAAGAEDV